MISCGVSFFATHYTLFMVIVGTTMLGATCGLLGTFGLLKGHSLFGDALSHAALPGVACAFLLTHSKNPAILMAGGAITGALATICLFIAQRFTRLKLDTLLGTLLSVFFGLGLIGMTVIQKLPLPNQAALNKFIFGSAATLMPQDVYCMAFVCFTVILCLACIWKEVCLATFDTVFAQAAGYRLACIDCMLACLLILLIAVGLQTVGVILMSALLIAPAAAARQWTTQIGSMAACAACIGGVSCLLGACMSYHVEHIPTGPIIVVVVTSIAFVSLCITPSRIKTV